MKTNARFIILLLACAVVSASPAGAAARIARRTIRASAVFTGVAAGPTLRHVPLERISAVTKIGLIEGEIADGKRIDLVRLEYKKRSELSWSTATIAGAGAANAGSSGVRQKFSFRLPPGILTGDIEYRLTVSDGLQTTVFPQDAPWQKVEVSAGGTAPAGPGGGVLRLKNGDPGAGQIALVIPDGALSGESNITMTEVGPGDPFVPPDAAGRKPVAVLRCSPDGLEFRKTVTLSLAYQDLDHDGVEDTAGCRGDRLEIKWWDGYDWRPMHSTPDRDGMTVSCRTRHFSLYALFPAGPVTDDDLRCKERIITPGSADAVNDYARFDLLAPGDVVEIFDVNGRRVREIPAGDIGWDGRDGSGALVPGGIYLYQVHHAGRIVSGRIIVAK